MPAGRRRSVPEASAAQPPGWTARSRRPICKGSSGSRSRGAVPWRLRAFGCTPATWEPAPRRHPLQKLSQTFKIGRTRNSSEVTQSTFILGLYDYYLWAKETPQNKRVEYGQPQINGFWEAAATVVSVA